MTNRATPRPRTAKRSSCNYTILAPFRSPFELTSYWPRGTEKPDFKWSSSNVYTEDAHGSPVYSWTILDQIFDTYAAAHVRPMVELGFMPQALSIHPDPYHIGWPLKPGQVEGWSFPPKDYTRWQELSRQVAAHLLERYGMATVSTWYWEVWNEPNLPYYWQGTEPEYNRLYDHAVAGVRQAIPHAIVGGPATTGPGPKGNASQYLHDFLAHCVADKVPLDFVSFHVKGQPNVVDGHVQMGLDHELNNAAAGFAIVREFPRFAHLPIILSEADPEGCAACSARSNPGQRLPQWFPLPCLHGGRDEGPVRTRGPQPGEPAGHAHLGL